MEQKWVQKNEFLNLNQIVVEGRIFKGSLNKSRKRKRVKKV